VLNQESESLPETVAMTYRKNNAPKSGETTVKTRKNISSI